MNLNYLVQPTDLGGTAVPGCGTIHQSEIKATLTKLSDDLEFPFDLNDYIIGSAGKREYSGDIDLVIDPSWWPHGVGEFRANLEVLFGKENVARNGDILHLKYPIIDYYPGHGMALPRTGFVQVDFNFGDAKWKQFYHYSCRNSAYKGAHRNLMLAAITSTTNLSMPPADPSEGVVIWEGDRRANIIRWIWGSNGLIRVHRKSVKDKYGHYKKKQEETVLEGPFTEPRTIMFILFPHTYNEHAMDSMETLMTAIKENYGMVDQERIWRRSAHNFSDWNQGKLFQYPLEISRYFLSNDK